jgi:hypothetical protein
MTFYEFGTEREITAGEWMHDGRTNGEKFVIDEYRTDEYWLMCRWIGVTLDPDGHDEIKKWQVIVWRAEGNEEPGEDEVQGTWYFDTKDEALTKYWSVHTLLHRVKLFGESAVRAGLIKEFSKLLHAHQERENGWDEADDDVLVASFKAMAKTLAEVAASVTAPATKPSCLTPKGWEEDFH